MAILHSLRLARIASAGILSLSLSCGSPDDSAEKPPRVVLLAIDGATWKVMEPLLAAGELPSFARLRREGAYAPRFGTLDTTKSPIVWTTVATGRAPSEHGIDGFAQPLPNGRLIPISSHQRTARAIWEVANQHGLTAGVVNWWASWPAEPVDGYVITDHANPAFAAFAFEDSRWWTAEPERLERLGWDFHPPDLEPVLRSVWLDKDAFPWDDLRRRGGFRAAQMRELREAPWNGRTPYSILKTFYAIDRPMLSAAIRLHRERPVDLQMIYVRGPDPIQHAAWDLVEPERFARRPPHLERDRGLVEGVYRYIDSLLGELLAAMDDDTWLLVASDHGAEPVEDADDPQRTGGSGMHTTATRGVLFIAGPHVRAGHRLEEGSDPGDLMPTMAWLLGLPLSAELMGAPLTDAFERELVSAKPVRGVATYGKRPARPPMPSPADEAMLESLRALGYIQ